jgi:hypothetical protein
MRHQLGRQAGQFPRQAGEMADADGEHDSPREEALARGKRQPKPCVRLLNGADIDRLQMRDVLALERHPVIGEDLSPDRHADIGVWQAVRRAILAECSGARWLEQVGGETFGFQEHALWHLGAPGVHRPAENPVFDATPTQVAGNRQSVWPGPHDCDVDH